MATATTAAREEVPASEALGTSRPRCTGSWPPPVRAPAGIAGAPPPRSGRVPRFRAGAPAGPARPAHPTSPRPGRHCSGCSPALERGLAEADSPVTAEAPCCYRLLTHPETGATLSCGRSRCRVADGLRMWLRIRDGICRFPGCAASAPIAATSTRRSIGVRRRPEHGDLARSLPTVAPSNTTADGGAADQLRHLTGRDSCGCEGRTEPTPGELGIDPKPMLKATPSTTSGRHLHNSAHPST